MDTVERHEHLVRFGRELRRMRREAGLSMEALGDRAGLHRTEIHLLEHAGREPRLTTIVKVARGLDISASRLLARVDLFDGREAPGGEEDPARAGSSDRDLDLRRAANGTSSEPHDSGAHRLERRGR